MWGAWLLHRGRLLASHLFLRVAAWAVVLPFLMNTAGWVLTENGRQPWIVQGLMKTSDGVSPSISAATIWFSLLTFTLLYGALGGGRVGPDDSLRAQGGRSRARGGRSGSAADRDVLLMEGP